MENGELKIVIPEEYTLHAMLNEEAYKVFNSLPKHKMDNFIQLTAKLDKTGDIRNNCQIWVIRMWKQKIPLKLKLMHYRTVELD